MLLCRNTEMRWGLPAKITEEYQILAQGEYNRNYRFTHPISQKELVLRVNFGSQMHLDNQIEYEYQALKLLESSGRTLKSFTAMAACAFFHRAFWLWSICRDILWTTTQNFWMQHPVWLTSIVSH